MNTSVECAAIFLSTKSNYKLFYVKVPSIFTLSIIVKNNPLSSALKYIIIHVFSCGLMK